MLESTSLLPSQGPFDLNPVTVTIFIGEAKEDHIGLFSEEFRFLCRMSQNHLFKWVVVSVDLLPDHIRSSHVEVDESLGFLDLHNDFLMVLQSVHLLKEDFCIFSHLLRGLRALHMLGDV